MKWSTRPAASRGRMVAIVPSSALLLRVMRHPGPLSAWSGAARALDGAVAVEQARRWAGAAMRASTARASACAPSWRRRCFGLLATAPRGGLRTAVRAGPGLALAAPVRYPGAGRLRKRGGRPAAPARVREHGRDRGLGGADSVLLR